MPDFAAAALAGLLAAQVMELPAKVQRALGLPVHQDIFAETGAILHAPHRWQRLIGWLTHGVTAAAVASAYAVFFAALSPGPPSIWLGLTAALIHNAIGGIVIAGYPVLHPDVPGRLRAPGFSYRHWGWPDVATFLVGHLVFGGLVTLLYRDLAGSIRLAAAG